MPTEHALRRYRRRVSPHGTALAAGLAVALHLGLPGPAQAAGDDPMSAIDWLSQSVSGPGAARSTSAPAKPAEPPITSGGALPVEVASTPLDGFSRDAVGLITPNVSGLPRNLWGNGLTDEISRAIIRDRMESLPALRQLFLTMLLAEADPPADSGGKGRLLQARIDKLLLIGGLEQAAALIDIAGDDTPDLFRRAFDIAILTGREDKACERMQKAPGLAPTLPARVFCLARGGDWDTAALTLTSAETLGDVDKGQTALLSRFLDPDLFEADTVPPPPNPVTPLDWKLYEAIGETIPTGRLPIAFAYAEIGPQAGWKAQIEAAERLTRAGTIAPNVLLGLYTERDPAASGSVWERVRAFQAFDAAMQSQDPARIAAALPAAWTRMQEAELEVPFAVLYGPALAALDLPPDAAPLAFRIGLLSPQFEQIARSHTPTDETERFLAGLALGQIEGLRPPDAMGRAIAPAFLDPVLSDEAQMLIGGMRLGEALLLSIEDIQRGVEGNPNGVTRGLSLLRKVRLENVARRTALELMILERRG
ncbi:hypothetical protein HOY34_00215 [Xinfangfangia sp. D13-10-4-6]|uniref:hypothetical protein n=1 Tax=Pseudogemmobacter hezensis TaxID=2737662 RepID=UPI001557A42D|nr:hypothetical protein [Pseudogemmobacter hezensis]NPD13623.1 hypothetical protein [Pseudogemmobacter hezensis]